MYTSIEIAVVKRDRGFDASPDHLRGFPRLVQRSTERGGVTKALLRNRLLTVSLPTAVDLVTTCTEMTVRIRDNDGHTTPLVRDFGSSVSASPPPPPPFY